MILLDAFFSVMYLRARAQIISANTAYMVSRNCWCETLVVAVLYLAVSTIASIDFAAIPLLLEKGDPSPYVVVENDIEG